VLLLQFSPHSILILSHSSLSVLLLLILHFQYYSSFFPFNIEHSSFFTVSVGSSIFSPFNVDPSSFFTVSVASPHSSHSILILPHYFSRSVLILLILILPLQFDPSPCFSVSVAPPHSSIQYSSFLILHCQCCFSSFFAFDIGPSSFFTFIVAPSSFFPCPRTDLPHSSSLVPVSSFLILHLQYCSSLIILLPYCSPSLLYPPATL
jgi:hypothetical protein